MVKAADGKPIPVACTDFTEAMLKNCISLFGMTTTTLLEIRHLYELAGGPLPMTFSSFKVFVLEEKVK